MRLLSFALLLAVMLFAAVSVRPALAVTSAPGAEPTAAMRQDKPPVPSNDDTRVRVQVGVLCAAVAVVVVAGTGAYFLRKCLGLVPPPPSHDAGGHH